MKLNDPFHRVDRKRQQNYHAFRDRLVQQGIRDRDSALAVAQSMSRNALVLAALLLLVTLVAALLLPQAVGIVLSCAILGGLWIGTIFFQARMHLKRYMLEQCGPANENSAGLANNADEQRDET